MTQTAIRVENLGKQYQRGVRENGYKTFREAISAAVTAPLHRFKRLSGHAHQREKFWALKDISFDVRHGEAVGIIGRNGAGKSTLLKILSRITEPTAGQAKIHGRVGSLLEVGTGFHPELTGRENVFLNGAVLGMSRAEIKRKFDEIVDFSGVEHFLDTPVKRYSTGMRVRLAFAVAAHLEPEILIVDEVLAVGDAEFQQKCLGKMSAVATRGRTVLFVSHNMTAVEGLCTKGILLEAGRLTFLGSSVDAVSQYLRGRSFHGSCESDLREHPNRTTRTYPVFQSLRLTDDSANTLSAVELGEPVTFEVKLESRRLLRRVCIGIHIYDVHGCRVATCHSAYQTAARLDVIGTRFVRCRVPSFRLAPSQYSVVLSLAVAKVRTDRIEPALEFEVVPRDVYGTGKVLRMQDGVYVPEVLWSFDNVERRQGLAAPGRPERNAHTHSCG